jgi:sugar fermentation stimulation protein A
MDFDGPLIQGTLIKRYKRFLADVTLKNGEVVTAHCPNTGSMKTCGEPGDLVYLSYHPSGSRKLKYTWELTKIKQGYVGVNTALPNQIVFEAIRAGKIPELAGYTQFRREVKYGSQNSRIDILLEGHPQRPAQKCWVEVKNTTLLCPPYVSFPDAVTLRGLKHLQELKEQVLKGDRAVIFFLVNREGGDTFRPAYAIDPAYCQALEDAVSSNVEALAYRSSISLRQIVIGSPLKVELGNL